MAGEPTRNEVTFTPEELKEIEEVFGHEPHQENAKGVLSFLRFLYDCMFTNVFFQPGEKTSLHSDEEQEEDTTDFQAQRRMSRG